MAASRLDCFLSIAYLYPMVIEPRDMDLMVQRDNELMHIYRYSGWAFFGTYCGVSLFKMIGRGRLQLPYMKTFVRHTCIIFPGTLCFALGCEKIAAELYYNNMLI